MDKLTVAGVGHQFDGEYDCDIVAMLDLMSPDALTIREADLIKQQCGARAGEVAEAFLMGDMKCRMAIALIVLRRHGKDLSPETVLDKPSGWMRFELGATEPQDEEIADASPPLTAGEKPATNGGGSSNPTLALPVKEPSPIGPGTFD